MIKIITDSTSDISIKEAKEFGIEVVPMTVTFADESFKDGIDLTNEEFYEKLSVSKELPVTSQINPNQFEEVFNKYKNDEILGIFISSKLSGTIQSALIAKNTLERDDIHIVDSKTATFAEGILVREAVKMVKEKMNIEDIVTRLNEISSRLKIYALVDTLKYLQYGGRISATTAVVGKVLNITPIISLEDGVVSSPAKVRGKKLGYKWIVDKIKDIEIDKNYPVAFGNANAPASMESLYEVINKNFDIDERNVVKSGICSAIGTHAGPGAVGIAFVSKE